MKVHHSLENLRWNCITVWRIWTFSRNMVWFVTCLNYLTAIPASFIFFGFSPVPDISVKSCFHDPLWKSFVLSLVLWKKHFNDHFSVFLIIEFIFILMKKVSLATLSFTEEKWKICLEGYLCYKTITFQNVSSEAR